MMLHGAQDLRYELKVSARAKRASLKVVPGRGVVVSIPKRFPRAQVAAFVESNRAWINESLAKIEANTPEHFRNWPPHTLPLSAVNLQLLLTYTSERDMGDVGQSDLSEYHLNIASPVDDKEAVASEIAGYLKQIARSVLPPLLASHAHLHKLSYKRVSIRGQRTVWGSYSSSGTLSLNYKLLFLSRELVDYVLLHELAHTVHLDHSEAFWQRLRQMSINARGLDRKLSKAGSQVPPWLELAR